MIPTGLCAVDLAVGELHDVLQKHVLGDGDRHDVVVHILHLQPRFQFAHPVEMIAGMQGLG